MKNSETEMRTSDTNIWEICMSGPWEKCLGMDSVAGEGCCEQRLEALVLRSCS